MLCAIWYHLHNLKNLKNAHGEVLLLVKLQEKYRKKAVLISIYSLAVPVLYFFMNISYKRIKYSNK